MEKDEFEYRLKELVAKVDSIVAADALIDMARKCYLQHANEVSAAQLKRGHELGAQGVEPF